MAKPTNDVSRALLLSELAELEANYWYEVDHNWGRAAHLYYRPDGTFTIDGKIMRGPDAVAAFYSWRESRGARTARHVVTNFRLTEVTDTRVSFDCILNLFAADGLPPLPSKPAIMIADIFSVCEREKDRTWRYSSHELVPVFVGDTPATIPQQ